MGKNWDILDIKKAIVLTQNEKNQQIIMKEVMKNNEQFDNIFTLIKSHLQNDYLAFLDDMSDFYDIMPTNIKKDIEIYIFDHSSFQSAEEIEHEINKYKFFKDVMKHGGRYISRLNIKKVIEDLQRDCPSYKEITQYLLSRIYFDYKLHKEDYLNSEEWSQTIHNLLDDYFYHQKQNLERFAQTLWDIDYAQWEEIQKKKIDKILMKSKQKYNQIISKKMITQEDIQIELETLSQQTKIKIENCQINDKQYYKEELQQFTEQCQHYSYVSKDEYQIIEENDEKTPNDINIDEIVRFYSFHHLYLKKTQIIEEVNQYPFILKFYIFYSQINDIDDKEEKIKKLEELVFDIKETGIKKKESLRRLLIIAQKEIEDIVNKEIVKDESDNELETVEDDIDDGGTIIQIGKFQVLSESAKKSPVNIQKLVQLLCPESQTQINELENLVFQIGYDKVYSYLLKSQFLSIENLSTINRLDRQLRFEYQHILEDIEMYFRSSLTYFITNKYDYQYIIPQTHQTFYKRGYLMNSIFLDGDDHYTLVKQLRERIDMEMKNQNLKLINEFKNHKYAISFSSAANIMPLGWVMSMFDNLNYHDKVEYLNCYYSQLTPQTFSSWMNNLTILRNRCAHYHSLYRLSSLKELRPIMTKACDSNGYDDDLKHSSLFYYTLVMTRLAPDIYNIEDFIDGVGVLFRKTKRSYADFNLQQDYSFPKNWRTMLENEKCVKMRNNESQR